MLKLKPINDIMKPKSQKRVTITLEFDCWNALMSTGEPKDTIERIITSWFQEYLDKQPVYVVSSNKPARVTDLGITSNPELLVQLNEDLARANALGRTRKAEAIRVKIAEVERDLLLAEKLKLKDSAE